MIQKAVLCFSVFIFSLLLVPMASANNFKNTEFYKSRYGLDGPFEKLLNNHGEGFEPLYGVRNFRVVLHGILYRSGANNKWNKHEKRANDNPMPSGGLSNLCSEGFSKTIYLYQKNYKSSPKLVACRSIHGEVNSMDYIQKSALFSSQRITEVLEMVYEAIRAKNPRPILAHCWNGWHASGYVGAIALKQYCGWSAEDALEYWNLNTDGHNTDPRYNSIKKRIENFQPIQRLSISKSRAEELCP